MLYPRESETREVKDLAGVWRFKVDADDEGRRKKWFARPLDGTIEMPVPASYNDITQDAAVRDHLGDVWYERTFFAPAAWAGRRVVLRFGSVTHHAIVWVNGTEVARHKGGFLPFEADVSPVLRLGEENRLTVVVNNILDETCLPPGKLIACNDPRHPKGYRTLDVSFDFFNYAGIHRPVRLVVTPQTYIADVTVTTEVRGTDGVVSYAVAVAGGRRAVLVRLLDEKRNVVARADGAKQTLVVRDANLWRPGRAYLYTLEIETLARGKREDCYRLPVGIRSVKVTPAKFLINGRPFYFKGCAKHEDADLRGKGHDDVTNVKDFRLLRWLGANSFRTSHYPYSEEIMNLADREGIVVIDEAPGVGMRDPAIFTDPALLQHHCDVMRDLVARDKNHPCVVMWSVANEATTRTPEAVPYFRRLASLTRRLDPARPVTLVTHMSPESCRVQRFFDVVCLNRYFSWYSDPGRLEVIEHQLERELHAWHRRFRQPVMLSEYGADTIAGLHQDPPVMFTEEYQCEMLERYHRVHDRLPFVIGEHVWNFADFATKQEVRRVGGNKKGVFTRQRQPKMAAHLLRQRWAARKDRPAP